MRTLLAVALINVQGKLHIQTKVPRNARFKGLFFGFSSENKIKTVIILSVIECLYTCHLEKAMAPHSSTFAQKIPWMEEPGRLQSMGLLESDTTERLPFHFSLSCIGEGNGNPLQCSCLENPRDGEAWWAAVYGVAQSRTRLKRLSSSSRKAWCWFALTLNLGTPGDSSPQALSCNHCF